MKKKRNVPNFYWYLAAFVVLIGFVGLAIISLASQIYEYPKYEKYSFSIFALSEREVVNFSSFRTNYNFESEEGSFSMRPNGNISRLILYFPKKFKITSIEHWENSSRKAFYFEYKNSTEKIADILFFNETKNEWIIINFKIDLSPNARFSFWKNSFWEGDTNFYFNMGNEFECIRQNCFFNLLNSDVDRDSLGTQQESSSSLKFTNQTVGVNSNTRHEFELSARSRKALTEKNLWISIGISFVVGCIFSLFSIIIAAYQGSK